MSTPAFTAPKCKRCPSTRFWLLDVLPGEARTQRCTLCGQERPVPAEPGGTYYGPGCTNPGWAPPPPAPTATPVPDPAGPLALRVLDSLGYIP